MTHVAPVALVTGSSGNLGGAVVQRLSSLGYELVRVERERARLGDRVCDVDLGAPDATRRLFESVIHQFGRLDAVVHTVGTFAASGPVEESDVSIVRALFETNVTTTLHVLASAIAAMKPAGTGRIVVVSSTASRRGGAGVSAYSASKAAQLRLVESAAAEVLGSGLTITAVLPGTLDTKSNRAAMPDADRSRWVSLDEVADVISFLCSEASRPLHGSALTLER